MYRIIKKGNKWTRKAVPEWHEVAMLILAVMGIVVLALRIVEFYG